MIMALLLILSTPFTPDVRACDMLELNHYHNACGCEVYTQYIFWKLHDTDLHVAAWRMKSEDMRLERRGNQGTLVIWNGTTELRITGTFKETWTNYDPERRDKNELPEAERMGL